jgi:hypothetical protein
LAIEVLMSTNDLLSKLAYAPRRPSSSDRLQVLGRNAAKRSASTGSSLTASVASVAEEAGDLNRHQVRRVVEYANQARWGDAGGASRFDPANADEVLSSIGPDEAPARSRSDDFLQDPTASAGSFDELAAAFKTDGGGADIPALRPGGDIQDAGEKVSSAIGLVDDKRRILRSEMDALGHSVYRHIKQAHLRDGYPLTVIGQVIEKTSSEDVARSVMSGALARLREDGVRVELGRGMGGPARVQINADHPLTVGVARLSKTAAALHGLDRTSLRLTAELKGLRERLRDVRGG